MSINNLESIRENGLLVPIVVNQEGFVLDGVHRYRACKELGISIKSITKQFKNPYQEKLFQIEVNLLRRQMTAFKRIEAGYSLEGATITGLSNGNGKESNSDQNERVASAEAILQSTEEEGKVSKIIAKKSESPLPCMRKEDYQSSK